MQVSTNELISFFYSLYLYQRHYIKYFKNLFVLYQIAHLMSYHGRFKIQNIHNVMIISMNNKENKNIKAYKTKPVDSKKLSFKITVKDKS